jgi:hypothetical protein
VNRTQDASIDAQESPFLTVSMPLSLGVPIEVVHPRGHVIRVPALFDAAARCVGCQPRVKPQVSPTCQFDQGRQTMADAAMGNVRRAHD